MKEYMNSSNHHSNLKPIVVSSLLQELNYVIDYYQSFINSYVTAIPYDDVTEMAGSVLSCFFSEYLARKLYFNHNPVMGLESQTHKNLEEKIYKTYDVSLKILLNIPSGTVATIISMIALLPLDSKILIMDSCCGGYWTQGSKNSKGKHGLLHDLYQIKTFHWDKNYNFDYFMLDKYLCEYKPQCLLLGFSAFTQLLDYKKIRTICDEYNCLLVADCAHNIGLMLGGLIPNCFQEAHLIIGTTYKTIRGYRGGLILTADEETMNQCKFYLHSMQVERGLNLVMANYLAVDHCFNVNYKKSMGYCIIIAQHIYKFFQHSSWELFNVKPLMDTKIPMVLLDLGVDAEPIIKIMLECKWHCSSFFIHGKYRGLRIITTNMGQYSLEEIDILLKQLQLIIFNYNKMTWVLQHTIKQNIKKINDKFFPKKNKTMYSWTINDAEDHRDIKNQMINIIKEQNQRLVMSTACLFTDLSLLLQGSSLMGIDFDGLSYSQDKHPYSGVMFKEDLHRKTNENLQKHLKLTHKIWTFYNLNSATSAILISLLTLINLNDKVLIVAENNGGHYSQGSTSSGGNIGLPKFLYDIKEFYINNNYQLDYEILEENLLNFRPQVLVLGFSSYTGLLNYPKIRQLCDKYNCYFVSDCSHTIGLMLAGIIPHCFNDAHITISSTYKTIPAVRGGLMITKYYDLYMHFTEKASLIQNEKGLNIIASIYSGIEECFSDNYHKKLLRSMEIASFIENYWIEHQIGKPLLKTEVHMCLIDFEFDIKEIFTDILQCGMDIGTCHIPHENRYGLRFICTTVAFLNYSNDDILFMLKQIHFIINKRLKYPENFSLTTNEILTINENIKKLTHKYPMYNI